MELPLFEFNTSDTILQRASQYLNDSIQQCNEALDALTNMGKNTCEPACEVCSSFQQLNNVVKKGNLAYYSSEIISASNNILDTISRVMVPACNKILASHLRENGSQDAKVHAALSGFEYPLKRLSYKPGFGIRTEKLSHRIEGATPQDTISELRDNIDNMPILSDLVRYDTMSPLKESLKVIVATPNNFDWNHVAHIYSSFTCQLKKVVDLLEKGRFLEISGLSTCETYSITINLLHTETLEALKTAQQMRQIIESSIEISILTQSDTMKNQPNLPVL